MTNLLHSFTQAVGSIHRERRRLYPMALGIVWGMASVMVLLAIAGGFEASQKKALSAYGERFLYLQINRAELDRASGGEYRHVTMDTLDIERLRKGAPAIRRFTPMNMAYRSRITGRSGAGTGIVVTGAFSEITKIRNMPLEEGRFYDDIDEAQRNRVIVLGAIARKQLFGAESAVGRTVRISGFSTAMIPGREPPPQASAARRRTEKRPQVADTRVYTRENFVRRSLSRPNATGDRDVGIATELFTVIGVLKDVEIQHESYVSLARAAFIPFSTSCMVFDRDFRTMLLEPRSPEDRDLALRQFKEVMGARYGFGPEDRNAVVVFFDSIARAKSIAAIFRGFRLFLAAVGALILGIGAIGVMNVVLVSVAARKFEIGLRKALGATPFVIYTQFFIETLLACLSSGGLGFLLGAGAIALVQTLPLPEGFSRPVLDAEISLFAFGLLAGVAVLVGIYPARRAALLAPVEALKGGG